MKTPLPPCYFSLKSNFCLTFCFLLLSAPLLLFSSCSFDYEDYCGDRAHAECRQVFTGACFEKKEQEEFGETRSRCEQSLERLCLDRRDDVEDGRISFDVEAAKKCVDLISAINCKDYKNKDSALQICDDVLDIVEDNILSF